MNLVQRHSNEVGAEKLRDIDEKRKRIEEESGTDEEEESGTNADLQEESQKYQQILASILGKSEPQKETAPVPNAPMSSLFEESEPSRSHSSTSYQMWKQNKKIQNRKKRRNSRNCSE